MKQIALLFVAFIFFSCTHRTSPETELDPKKKASLQKTVKMLRQSLEGIEPTSKEEVSDLFNKPEFLLIFDRGDFKIVLDSLGRDTNQTMSLFAHIDSTKESSSTLLLNSAHLFITAEHLDEKAKTFIEFRNYLSTLQAKVPDLDAVSEMMEEKGMGISFYQKVEEDLKLYLKQRSAFKNNLNKALAYSAERTLQLLLLDLREKVKSGKIPRDEYNQRRMMILERF